MLTIALCYDLKTDYLSQGFTDEECLELDTQETIDAITNALEDLGHNVVKIGNIYSLVKHLANENKPAWDLVFNVSEVLLSDYSKNIRKDKDLKGRVA